MAQNSVKAIPLSTFNSANLLANYQVVNTNGIPEACFLIRIVNGATTSVTISYDGATDHEFIPANGSFDLQAQANAQPNAYVANIPKFTKIYVKGTAGIGTISVSGYYV